MKIKKEHYEMIKSEIAKVLRSIGNVSVDTYIKEKIGKDHYKRFRWDCFHATAAHGFKQTAFICNTLYPYLNDDHIDTALRSILDGFDYNRKQDIYI